LKANTRPIQALFVNTRSRLGADVAVHLQLIRHLDPAQCQVTLATNSRASDLQRTLQAVEDVPGLQVVTLNLGYELYGRGRFGRWIAAAGNGLALLWSVTRLAGLIRLRKIDLLHSTDRPRDALISTLLARLTGRRNLLHVHIKWTPHMGRATRWAVEHCDAVLAISQFVRRSLLDGGVPEKKIYTVLNATDAAAFDPQKHAPGAFRARWNIAPETPLLGIIARVMVWKGHRELVEALAKVRERFPQVRLAIVGEVDHWMSQGGESYYQQLLRRIEELGLTENVLWIGWQDAIPSVMADLDVVCVPSVEEPFGLVITEAMAMERPVVGFASGAQPEIITDGEDGLLVPSGDCEALAGAIVRLLEDPALRQMLGKRARQTVIERFSPARQADEMLRVYRALLSV
jgi:glycosyltransferase involved in cell wall biosynthesis